MAINKITKSVRISWTGDGNQIVGNVTESFNQIGKFAFQNVQLIQSTSESITFGDVTTPKYLMFKNANDAWSSLTNTTKALYTDEDDYNTKNRVFLGTTNPTTSGNATIVLKPQASVLLDNLIAAWYACKATDNVYLSVIALEA